MNEDKKSATKQCPNYRHSFFTETILFRQKKMLRTTCASFPSKIMTGVTGS